MRDGTEAQERALVKALARDTVSMFETKHSNDLIAQANTIASRLGIDGKYVQYVLARDSTNWPSLPGRQTEALKAMVMLAHEFYVFDYAGFTIPEFENEAKVNEAIKELGKWAWGHRKSLRTDYIKVIKPHVPQARAHLNAFSNRDWSDRDSLVWLHGAMRKHIEDSPAGIMHSLTVYRLVDLFF